MKKLATKSRFKIEQLALIMSAFSLIGVAVLGVSEARHGQGGGTGNGQAASIFVTPECISGKWVNHGYALLNSSAISAVDFYESINDTQIRKIVDAAPLTLNSPWSFDSAPVAGVSTLRMYILVRNNQNPAPLGTVIPAPNEAVYTSNAVVNPCAADTSGKFR